MKSMVGNIHPQRVAAYPANSLCSGLLVYLFEEHLSPETSFATFLDSHSTHVSLDFIEIAKSNQIEVLCFPSKRAHIAQPLDQIFGYMKEVFAQTALSLKLVRSDVITNKSKFPWSVYLVKKAFGTDR